MIFWHLEVACFVHHSKQIPSVAYLECTLKLLLKFYLVWAGVYMSIVYTILFFIYILFFSFFKFFSCPLCGHSQPTLGEHQFWEIIFYFNEEPLISILTNKLK